MEKEIKEAKVIAVCSAVGGVGRTAVSANLAVIFARQHVKVTVIDADLQFGDMALAFNLFPNHTLKEAAERKDAENIAAYTMNHESGVHVLPAPARPEYAELVSVDFLLTSIAKLKESSDIILIETAAGITGSNLPIMEKADHIFVVSTPSMASLKNTRLMIETLELLGQKKKVQLVINQYLPNTMLPPREIPKLTQMEEVNFLPYERKQMGHSLDRGIPYVTAYPKSAFSKEIVNLAGMVEVTRQEEIEKPSKRNLLQQMFRKGRKGR